MPSLRTRCPKGTRKNRSKKSNGECIPSVRLAPEDITKLIQKHGLKPSASKMLKKLRLTKRTQNKTYTYKSAFDDKTNLMRQADAVIVNTLKNGPSVRRNELRSPMTKRMVSKGSPLKGTAF